MGSPAPLPEDPRTPELEELLAEKPYVVLVKEKGEKKKKGLRSQAASSDAKVESTHSSSTEDEEKEEEEESEASSPKRGKRATSEGVQEADRPRQLKRL